MAKCPVCSNLQPDLLSDVPIGNRAVLFVPIADLKLSISAPSSSCCPECALIWHALTCYKTTWDETDSTQSVELRIAVGKPLQLFFRREGLYLELFSRRPNGVYLLRLESIVEFHVEPFQKTVPVSQGIHPPP
jgi:hypothetical protein